MEIDTLASAYFVIRKKKKLEAVKQHIWDLIRHYLHKHNELCLLDFGRFAAQSNDFSVDPIAKKITPAQKRIYFQAGTFAYSPEFLLFSETILPGTTEEIVHNLNQFILRFKAELQQKKRIEIEYLGIFKYNVLGEIDFESVQSDPFLDNTFGLKPIHFAANLLKIKRIVVERPEEEDAALVEMRKSALKELKVLLDNARVAESNQVQKSNKVFPIVATVLTLILLSNLALYLYKGPVDELKQQISQMNIFGNAANILDSQQLEITVPTQVEIPNQVEPKSVTPAVTLKEEVKTEPAIVEAPEKNEVSETTETSKPIAVESNKEIAKEVTGAATIGKYLTKGSFEFDSTIYSILPDAPAAALVQPETKTTETTALANSNKSLEAATIETPTENTEGKADASDYDLPYMLNVDAQINDIEKGFYVIAGAFKIEANANNYKDQLIKKGNASAIVIKPSKYPYYLVSYQKDKNLSKALSLLEQKEKNHPSIWVYCAY
ncbi:MAG: SPOR domain-containing protein [Bacteroidia bacterium]